MFVYNPGLLAIYQEVVKMSLMDKKFWYIFRKNFKIVSSSARTIPVKSNACMEN